MNRQLPDQTGYYWDSPAAQALLGRINLLDGERAAIYRSSGEHGLRSAQVSRVREIEVSLERLWDELRRERFAAEQGGLQSEEDLRAIRAVEFHRRRAEERNARLRRIAESFFYGEAAS